jgi:hypothetical protein
MKTINKPAAKPVKLVLSKTAILVFLQGINGHLPTNTSTNPDCPTTTIITTLSGQPAN